jgi:hypothetical protein
VVAFQKQHQGLPGEGLPVVGAVLLDPLRGDPQPVPGDAGEAGLARQVLAGGLLPQVDLDGHGLVA